ncbi:hypothetical protein NKG05_04105 [Oerskovia sp. M15]
MEGPRRAGPALGGDRTRRRWDRHQVRAGRARRRPDGLDEILVERVTSTRPPTVRGLGRGGPRGDRGVAGGVPAGVQVLGVGLAVPGTVDEGRGSS